MSQSLLNKGDSVIVSSLAHYTEFLAVEVAGGVVREVPLDEKNIVTAEATAQKIEEAGQLLGVQVLDNIVLARDGYCSMREGGWRTQMESLLAEILAQAAGGEEDGSGK